MHKPATLEAIQEATRRNRQSEAEEMLRHFLAELFGLAIERVEVRRDTLSLNSVNGFITLKSPDPKSGAEKLFFKFHHEENEEGLKEYYNSRLLEENGFPVEMPVYASHEVGKQVLLYPFKTSERMADICKRLDTAEPANPELKSILEAQGELDALCLKRYLGTLHEAPIAKIHDEPILQLFHHRLTDDRENPGSTPGGRYKQFYAGKVFELPEHNIIRYEDLASLSWRINGTEYKDTLAEAFKRAFLMLAPSAHASAKNTYPAVVAHGDAHNGNVWYNPPPNLPPQAGGRRRGAALSLFDPAFAGPHIPALLAEIKPTFHNIFAHPLWLYDAQEADAKLHISFAIEGDHIQVEHDWKLSSLRQGFLELKRDRLWKPLIKALRERNLLPAGWQDYIRSALFCCPTLVMNLRAHAGSASNSHTPKTSLLGLAVSMMVASAPAAGSDTVSDFFAELE
jgi:hypothetical protein